MKAVKPLVENISMWDSQTEILYKCPKCNTSFRIFGQCEKYCHNCGQKIDWNVPQRLKVPYERPTSLQKHEAFISALNKVVKAWNF